MKIINLPTIAEYYSSRNGCGLNYTNNYRGKGGQFKKHQQDVYYSYCHLLDRYANEYLDNFKYISIELATDHINHYAKKRQQEIKRTKLR
jgi:hypothetical protein